MAAKTAITYPNEELPPARRLELARKNRGLQVSEIAEALGVSRNLVTDYQTPGKIKNYDINKVLMWCLLCEVRPSWVDPAYEFYDPAVEARLGALHGAGTNFFEEITGKIPSPEAPKEIELPDFLRVEQSRRYWTLLSQSVPWLPSPTFHADGTYPDASFDTYWN